MVFLVHIYFLCDYPTLSSLLFSKLAHTSVSTAAGSSASAVQLPPLSAAADSAAAVARTGAALH